MQKRPGEGTLRPLPKTTFRSFHRAWDFELPVSALPVHARHIFLREKYTAGHPCIRYRVIPGLPSLMFTDNHTINKLRKQRIIKTSGSMMGAKHQHIESIAAHRFQYHVTKGGYTRDDGVR